MVKLAPIVFTATGTQLSGNNIITTTTGGSVATVSVSNSLAVGDIIVFTSIQTVSVGNGAHPANRLLTVTSAASTSFKVAMGSAATSASAATGGLVTIAVQTTTTSQWYPLDFRFDETLEHGFYITNASASNQSITIQVAASALDANSSTANFYNVSTYTTTSATGTLAGNWPAVRFVAVTLDGTGKIIMTR